MSLGLCFYLIGFILFLSIFSSGVIWGAILAGVPHVYISLGTLIVFVIGIALFKIFERSQKTGDTS